jgi:uncharacterized membrane protein YgcG
MRKLSTPLCTGPESTSLAVSKSRSAKYPTAATTNVLLKTRRLFERSNYCVAHRVPWRRNNSAETGPIFQRLCRIVSKPVADRFNEQLAQFEREASDQLVVAVFPTMQSNSDIADYTQRVAQAWGVGQKERRNGVVLFVFIKDRKMFIQVGYGLEGALPDITAFDITENKIKPHFRSGDYEGGIAVGIDSIIKAIRGEYKGSGKTVAEQQHRGGRPFSIWSFIIFLIILIIISKMLWRLGGYGYSNRGGGPYSFRWAAVAVGPREEAVEVDLAGSAAEAGVSAEVVQDQIGRQDANEGISQQTGS